jgi:hypothetical protein
MPSESILVRAPETRPERVMLLRIQNLSVGATMADLLVVRHQQDVGVTVRRREGEVRVLVDE